MVKDLFSKFQSNLALSQSCMNGWKYGGAGQIGQGSPWVLQGYHTDAQMPLYINFVDMAYMYVIVINQALGL